MYTSCHGANIVMTNCTIVSQKNVAVHATMVSDVTIAHTNITIAAPWQLVMKIYMTTLYLVENVIRGIEN